MKDEQVLAQSKAAYGQWASQWRANAKAHSQFVMKSFADLENSGIGRAALCVANGFSFEENIGTIKELAHNVDIICCDKSLGHLIANGIRPKYCIVADANVNYEKYLKPFADRLSDTTLIMNVCGNPEWTTKCANWKDIYFFVNKDILGSEAEFCGISGCQNVVPAGTNVSNAMVIVLSQSDNKGRTNFFGYDKILLIGFDYSWRFDGNYYAFDKDAGGKAGYMRHNYVAFSSGKFGYTSGNLHFSAQWLENYIRAFNLPVVNCAPDTMLGIKTGDLREHMSYSYRPEDAGLVRSYAREYRELVQKQNEIKKRLTEIGRDHWNSFVAST